MRPLIALVLGIALLPACVSQSGYLNNRGADFVDIFRGNLEFGAGIGAKLEATRLIQLGVLYSHNVFAVGLENRAVGAWRQSVFTWGVLVGEREESTHPIPYVSGSYGYHFGDEQGDVFRGSEHGGGLDLLTFRIEAMLVLGVDFEFRFGEFLDFLAGIFQFDPSSDDVDYKSRPPTDPSATEDEASTAG